MRPHHAASNGLDPRMTDGPAQGTMTFGKPCLQVFNDGVCQFDVYRADQVSLTSTLFCGGDWHWRLISVSGEVLIDCGGYATRNACYSAVDLLRHEAASATVLHSN